MVEDEGDSSGFEDVDSDEESETGEEQAKEVITTKENKATTAKKSKK